MGILGRSFFLSFLVVVLILCQAFAQSPTSRVNKRLTARNRLRNSGECKDEGSHHTCMKVINELGHGVCNTIIDQLKKKLERSCSASCHYCGEPLEDCRTSRNGCCWDASTPSQDPYGRKGCPECKDHLSLCKRFKKFCTESNPGNIEFMQLHCPLTCGRCVKRRNDFPITGQKIQMNDWRKL
ncbi:uncharacterized protein LOC111335449 [Stylophora pistillata]|uniref:uncharacterized protein LOC111335449 n=1 Tax=Stylophora pistillata TaxID=50429 RepID=UPI000C03B130|nr:uncharacterized protein LOC111335449 [Stylophora pistillata]